MGAVKNRWRHAWRHKYDVEQRRNTPSSAERGMRWPQAMAGVVRQCGFNYPGWLGLTPEIGHFPRLEARKTLASTNERSK
jgi:hypothetical protein